MKRQYFIRTLAFLLAALMLLTAMACGKADSGNDAVETTTAATTAPASDTTAATEATTLYPDDLPEDLRYDGEVITFLYREEIASEFTTDGMIGDIVNDAIYESILSVEDRLGVDIQTVLRKGHTTDVRAEYMNHIENQVMAGDDTYDWTDMMIGNATVRAQTGVYRNLLTLENLDLSKPWYIPNMKETVSIADRLFFVSGDASLGYLKSAFCIYVNQKLAENCGAGDLNAIVKEGKWTVETVAQLAAQAAQDLDGNGLFDLNDQLGFVSHDSNHPRGFIASTGITLFTKNEDGSHSYAFGTDRDHTVCTALSTLKTATQGSYFFNGTNANTNQIADYQKISSMFISGQIMMISAEMDDVIACGYHEMEDPYGVLPYPKYDEAQENYYTSSRSTHNAFLMPVTCPNPEMAAAVLEALGASNYTKVLPNYFELALKTKYSADSETSEIFDIIHDSMVLDFGYTYDNAVGNPVGVFNNVLNNINAFSSTVKAQARMIDKLYAKMIETVEAKCTE
ncbi:MAG: hypothetical protein IJW99_09735 [Clostridia bacterium]|nr:hypothetical protein [Clostridia bacterium]